MQMFQKGRSMIEMLGVLAIIGVLSIGGLLGYRRAVNNHQANTILDDANRLAFVITERDNFAPNDNITNVEFNQTSTYSIVPFVGEKARQYGIMVENVPKGVCEALVSKAAIEYKVRVMPYQSTEYINQIADTGTVYDSFHKDICTNDTNDVVLFFGDTSAQCNKPDEGEDYANCNTNADCCGDYFCAFQNPSDCFRKGSGKCMSIAYFGVDSQTITANGVQSTWIRNTGNHMTRWSAENWCLAQGKQLASRKDIGCEDIAYNNHCTDSDAANSPIRTGSVLAALSQKWTSSYNWLNDNFNSCLGYYVSFGGHGHINVASRNDLDYRDAMCH